ncbi:MAG: tyrosine-type recombinase/integrase [Bdellovibrionales bacterium]
MAQRIVVEDGKERLLIDVSVRCRNHPQGRIFRRRRLDGIGAGSAKANQVEKELFKEVQREKTEREMLGVSWETLVNLYEQYTYPKVIAGEFVQSKQTFDEATRALRKWTADWSSEISSRIRPADITRLFHKVKEAGGSDSFIGKLRGDLKKVFEFGIVHSHILGMERSPTDSVSIKSRRRVRTEILNEEEIKKLLVYGRQYEPNWFFIWAFAVYTGARNGELYALKWTDIDEAEQIITIQSSYNKKTREYKGTKTDEWRKVSICKPLQKIIKELRAIRDHDIQRGAAQNIEFVLPRPGLWQNGEQARVLRLFCEEIGITPICFHTLRACFATELLKRGVPVPRVMRVGGWKSVKTMMHYVRLAGIEDKGITDPLDFQTDADQVQENQKLMDAVGEKFRIDDVRDASVICLATRRRPIIASS